MTTYGEKTYYSDRTNCPICDNILVVGTAKIAYDVNTPAKHCNKDYYTLYYAPTKLFAGRYKERRLVYDTYVFYDSFSDSTQFLMINASKRNKPGETDNSKWSGPIKGKHIFSENLEEMIRDFNILQ